VDWDGWLEKLFKKGDDVKTPEIIDLIVKELPLLVQAAEGIFSWAKKAGSQKFAWVYCMANMAIHEWVANSTGGQKDTVDKYLPALKNAIDATAGVLYPRFVDTSKIENTRPAD
jgi:hypothetical protein